MSNVIDKAISWMLETAKDDTHGYSQYNRWGPDYDCSSFIITAFEQAGLKIKENGGSYTGNMRSAFEKCGFKAIKYSKNLVLVKGDIFLNEKHHVVCYIGDGQIVHASIDENGTIVGKKPGDQTQREICTRSFYTPSYGWDYVLRYVGDEVVGNPYPVPTMNLKKGMVNDYVSWLQYELKEAGFDIKIDKSFGPATLKCLTEFQKLVNIECDGICGPITRQKLIENVGKIDKLVNPYNHIKVTLKKGSKGESVRWIQWELNQRGNYGLVEDGIFGKLTENAVKQYQRSVGLSADGIVGPKTWAILES